MFNEAWWVKVLSVLTGLVVLVFIVLVLTPRPGPDPVVPTSLPGSAQALPEPTFDPVRSEPPANGYQATEHARELAKRYYSIRRYVHSNPGEGDGLRVYVRAPLAESELAFAQMTRQQGVTLRGDYAFEPDMSRAYAQEFRDPAGDPELLVPFGMVTLSGCQDDTDLDVVGADGAISTPAGAERYRVVLTILYVMAEGKWVLSDIKPEGEGSVAC